MSELKSCWRCGRKAILTSRTRPYLVFYVRCYGCGSKTQKFRSAEFAMEVWNQFANLRKMAKKANKNNNLFLECIMGVRKKHSGGCYTLAPNPDPKRFKIVKGISLDMKHILLVVHYPGCTTHGGNKILIVKGNPEDIVNRKEIDPHFLENDTSPIARFPATFDGEVNAMWFLKMLGESCLIS